VALFRVRQEALNNVHRHSGSNRAFIRLYVDCGCVNLKVRDVGKGIPPGLLDESPRDSMGSPGVELRGMRQRMRHFGGDLIVVYSVHGAEVQASLPLEFAAAACGSSNA